MPVYSQYLKKITLNNEFHQIIHSGPQRVFGLRGSGVKKGGLQGSDCKMSGLQGSVVLGLGIRAPLLYKLADIKKIFKKAILRLLTC